MHRVRRESRYKTDCSSKNYSKVESLLSCACSLFPGWQLAPWNSSIIIANCHLLSWRWFICSRQSIWCSIVSMDGNWQALTSYRSAWQDSMWWFSSYCCSEASAKEDSALHYWSSWRNQLIIGGGEGTRQKWGFGFGLVIKSWHVEATTRTIETSLASLLEQQL